MKPTSLTYIGIVLLLIGLAAPALGYALPSPFEQAITGKNIVYTTWSDVSASIAYQDAQHWIDTHDAGGYAIWDYAQQLYSGNTPTNIRYYAHVYTVDSGATPQPTATPFNPINTPNPTSTPYNPVEADEPSVMAYFNWVTIAGVIVTLLSVTLFKKKAQ